MKKLSAALICAAMMIFLSFASFAEVTPELRQAADSVNIEEDAEGVGDEIVSLYNQGVHVFDTGALLTDEEKESLETKLSSAADETGFAVAVFTADDGDSDAADAEDFADMIYYYGDLGEGDDKDGVILVIDMYIRSVYIYTHGIATRYITDSMINYVYDDLDGGLYNSLSDGDYAKACNIFADGVLEAYRGGISSDQANYDTETGETDYYAEPAEKSLFNPVRLIVSLILSLIIGIIPVNSTKKKYAMKAEKAQAQRFNLSYRADSAYAFSGNAARLISKHVTTAPIPRPKPSGGGGHGGGFSSGSSGRGGSFHGGGGRSF